MIIGEWENIHLENGILTQLRNLNVFKYIISTRI